MAIIQSGLEAIEMRNKMESKEALAAKGSLYVGTGGTTTITKSDNSTVPIPETTAFNPPNTTDANGGVMIWDTSVNSDTGWAVAKIKTKNLENGRVEQANKADRTDTILSNGEYKSFVDAFVQECLLKIYPVGSIYMCAEYKNPKDFLGGTWVEWGKGRVPVGVNSEDTDFAEGKTGGEKTHRLSVDEMPWHNHEGTNSTVEMQTIHTRPTGGALLPLGISTYTVKYDVNEQTQEYMVSPAGGQTLDVENGTVINSQYGVCPEGGSGAHNNLQPYITCYMWKRTA